MLESVYGETMEPWPSWCADHEQLQYDSRTASKWKKPKKSLIQVEKPKKKGERRRVLGFIFLILLVFKQERGAYVCMNWELSAFFIINVYIGSSSLTFVIRVIWLYMFPYSFWISIDWCTKLFRFFLFLSLKCLAFRLCIP